MLFHLIRALCQWLWGLYVRNKIGQTCWDLSVIPLSALPVVLCVCRGKRIHPIRHAEIHPPLWPSVRGHRAVASHRIAGSGGPGLWLWAQLLVLVWLGLGYHPGKSTLDLVLMSMPWNCPTLRNFFQNGLRKWVLEVWSHSSTQGWLMKHSSFLFWYFLSLPTSVLVGRTKGAPNLWSCLWTRSHFSCWEDFRTRNEGLLVTPYRTTCPLASFFPNHDIVTLDLCTVYAIIHFSYSEYSPEPGSKL